MNTLYTFGGTSGTGKSTRVHALLKFLRSKYPCKRITFTKDAGYLFFDHLLFLGKEIQRGHRIEYQGVDLIYRSIGGNHPEFYKKLFEMASEYSVIAETAVLLRTNRSRPAYIAESPYAGNFKVYCRFYYYDIESPKGFELYKKRIHDRSGNVMTEDSSMWNSNREFYRYVLNFKEEKEALPEDKKDLFEIDEGDPSEPVYTIGSEILKREGMGDLIPEFIEFCNSNISLVDSPELKRRTLF